MTAHIPHRQLVKSTTYTTRRETPLRGTNILRCVSNDCENPRLPPFTKCRVCCAVIWRQAAQKAARSRKRMAKARSGDA